MPKFKYPDFDPNGVGLTNGHFIGLPFQEADAKVVLLSIPWDLTVSDKDGTSTGPENILRASYQLDLYDADVPNAWKTGIFLRESPPEWLEKNQCLRPKAIQYIQFVESGGLLSESNEMQVLLSELNQACEDLKSWVRAETEALISKGKSVGLVGGDHSIPLGFMETLAEKEGNFGVLQIDAHMDLRKAYEGFTLSHASIFYNALEITQIEKLVQVGIRDTCEAEWAYVENAEGKIVVFPDQEIAESAYEGLCWEKQCEEILCHLPEKVYISFDIDGLDPELCPNTGTPVPGGLDLNQAFYLIKKLMLSGRKLIGFDLSEVAGRKHEWDGNVGARILYKLANWLGQQ